MDLKKRNLRVFMAIAAVIIVVGSAAFILNENRYRHQNQEMKVAGIVFQQDQFMEMLTAGMQQAAMDEGIKFEAFCSEGSQMNEAELLKECEKQNISGIAIAPLDAVVTLKSLKKLSESGIEIGLCNLMTTENTDFCVGGFAGNDEEIGKSTGEACGRYIKEHLDGKANVAIIEYNSLSPEGSELRTRGFVEGMDGQVSDAVIIAREDAWTVEDAIRVTEDIIKKHPDTDIIWSATESATVGTTMALRNMGIGGKTVAFGTDVTEEIIAMLESPDNILQAVTAQDPYEQGYQTMLQVIRSARDRDMEKNSIRFTENHLLERRNMDKVQEYKKLLQTRLKIYNQENNGI